MNPLMNLVGVFDKSQKSIVEQFKEFRNSFKGDQQDKINEMLASGQITKQQLNEATEITKMIKGLRHK